MGSGIYRSNLEADMSRYGFLIVDDFIMTHLKMTMRG